MHSYFRFLVFVLTARSSNLESVPRGGVPHLRRTSLLCLLFGNPPPQSSATAHCSTLDLPRSPLAPCLDSVTCHINGISICNAVCVDRFSFIVIPLVRVSHLRRNKCLVLHLQPLPSKRGLAELRVAWKSYQSLACKECGDVLSVCLLLFVSR